MADSGDDFQFGSDSFLDVVTNVVGILIILVVVVGLRVKNAPAVASPAIDLETPRAEVTRLQGEMVALDAELTALENETSQRQAERAQVAYLVSTAQMELDAHREKLSQREQALYDLRRQIAAHSRETEALEGRVAQLAGESREVVEIETFPTPIAQTVEGEEFHFQLRAGLVTPIPLEGLIEQCKLEAKQRMWKLQDVPEFTGTVGPAGGFRLRYTLERVDIAMEGGARVAAYAQLAEWELLPVSEQLGETVAEALEPGSEFRRTLATLRPGRTTITLWTYPDSFDLYRALKKELFHAGFATAGRPLPSDVPIGGSPEGSRSAAQ